MYVSVEVSVSPASAYLKVIIDTATLSLFQNLKDGFTESQLVTTYTGHYILTIWYYGVFPLSICPIFRQLNKPSDAFVATKPKPEPKKLSAEKAARLRDFLSSRSRVPVVKSAPANLKVPTVQTEQALRSKQMVREGFAGGKDYSWSTQQLENYVKLYLSCNSNYPSCALG